ncbi:NnrS family protein [Halobacteriovorax vibrionivorans]|uniref:NnrS family protein n=1 Tax=Halobacteriovorax vibrionivorans TaxID=2152716 RepID=A0ABY0IFS7_9BACT|nr:MULTISPECIES: NnrS family protein [Halobacteriovorax]RZF20394.1 NnrS family protein [Halobacteriovorax vibrionivorans]TGD46567.1 NnrS family protein [Halobacteriovorax sp. Y22]
MKNTLPVFNISFRPFFLLAAIIAIINVTFWVSAFVKGTDLGLVNFDPLFWHGHEMLFGFTSALIIGFLFTASSHWTQTTPYRGCFLIFLVALWLMERFSYFLNISHNWSIILLNIFYPASIILLFLKLRKNKQVYIFIPLLSTLWILSILHTYGYMSDSLSLQDISKNSASAIIRLLILLILGRVIPFFTKSRFKDLDLKINVPKFVQRFSILTLIILALPLSLFLSPSAIIIVYLICIIFNTLRVLYWKPLIGMKEPMIAVLYIGSFALVFGLVMELIGFFNGSIGFSQAPLHMLLAFGLGSVAIGMMTRVSLGHTGRIIKADKYIIISFVFVIIGALIRVFVPIIWNEFYETSLHYASGFWTLGFIIYLIKFFWPLVTKRPDGKFG